MDGRIIIGCGTGRCGTASLAYLLRQNGINATHELPPHLPWEVDEKLLASRIEYFRNAKKPVADVAFYYLPYLPFLLRKFPELVVVGLRRDREETIRSFEKKLGDRNPFNPFKEEDHIWGPCYPKFPFLERRVALGRFWDMYYQWLGLVASKFWGRVRIFRTEDLGKEDTQREILRWCGVTNPRPIPGLKLNTGPTGWQYVYKLKLHEPSGGEHPGKPFSQ